MIDMTFVIDLIEATPHLVNIFNHWKRLRELKTKSFIINLLPPMIEE